MQDLNASSIDEYIAFSPEELRERLSLLRETIQKAAPEATETINYKIPTFKVNGNLVHFAGYKKHIGFYPAPSGIKKFEKELSPYPSAKGSVQFPHDQPLPLDLITRIVKFRVEEQNKKSK